jgi:hypothetical protein
LLDLAQKGEATMRFMMILPVPAAVEANIVPNKEMVTAMRKYTDDMRKSGILLAAEGLHPNSKGKRISVANGKHVVTDGPFTEAKEVVAGFWMIQVRSEEEALEWANRCPLPECGILELRQIFETSDFPPELRPKSAQA